MVGTGQGLGTGRGPMTVGTCHQVMRPSRLTDPACSAACRQASRASAAPSAASLVESRLKSSKARTTSGLGESLGPSQSRMSTATGIRAHPGDRPSAPNPAERASITLI